MQTGRQGEEGRGTLCVCVCKCVNVSAARDKAARLLQLQRPLMDRMARELALRVACPSVSGQVEMLNAFNKSQQEWRMRAWPATGRGDLSGQTLNQPHLILFLPPALPFFAVPTVLACGNRISAYLRPQMKMPCYWFLLCFFPSPSSFFFSRFICRQLAIQFSRCFDKY